jgi:hypothetical protein
MKKEPVVVSVTNDDGSHSHYALICSETGDKLWSENPIECAAQGFPVKRTEFRLINPNDKK